MAPENLSELPHDIACLSQEMHEALMTYVPEYFDLTPEAREIWRSCGDETSEHQHSQIRDHLLINSFGISPEDIEKAAADGIMGRLDLSPEVNKAMNLEMLTMDGIGADMFYLNEHLPSGQTLLSLNTVYDFDKQDHDTQMVYREPDERFTYQGNLYCAWARMLKGGKLKYLIMSTYAGYILQILNNADRDVIKELVPHEYVKGPHHLEKSEDGYIRWDYRLDANGNEDLHNALMRAANLYQKDRFDRISDHHFTAKIAKVWQLDGDQDHDEITVVFSDPEAMKKTRFRHFGADCSAISGDPEELKADCDAEVNAQKDFLSGLYKVLAADPEKCVWIIDERPNLTAINELLS